MSALGWTIILSLPLYALLQVLLILKVGDRVELGEDRKAMPRGAGAEWDSDHGHGPDSGPGSEASPEPTPAAGVVCRACGAGNDPAYTYCGNCVARLAAG